MNSEAEVWKPVVGWPDYEVSNLGRVKRTTIKISIIRERKLPSGYKGVSLWLHAKPKKKQRTGTVHIMVAEAFLGPRPSGHDIHHKDRDRMNASATNLEYLPEKQHMSMHAKQENRKAADMYRRDMILKCKAIGLTHSQIIRAFDVPPSNLLKMISRAKKRGTLRYVETPVRPLEQS